MLGRDPATRHALLDNASLAEWLAAQAEHETGNVQRAMRRASLAALLWPVEAAELLAAGGSLTDLRGVGPYLAWRLHERIRGPEQPPDPTGLRTGFRTLAWARSVLGAHPIEAKALHGDLQVHTLWSDGDSSVAQMGEAAGARGYRYVALTDHSRGLPIANGMTEARLAAQIVEIDAWNARQLADGVRLLRGIEMNLDPEGRGDMDAAALEPLDVVLGAFHSALRRKYDQTERYLKALSHPLVTILAHPRTRKFGRRAGLSADWSRVFGAAAASGKAVEIDGDPSRQDLQEDVLEIAVREGATISLGSDAHSPSDYDFIDIALASAIDARVPPERIVNFWPAARVVEWSHSLRG